MLEIKNLYYSKHFKKILNNLSLKIEDKEKVIIVGENGCGKTTLLKIMSGGIKANINSNFKNVFYLSDKFNLPANKEVKNFLYEASYHFKVSLNIDYMMNLFELENKKIKHLSKGNYKKTALLYSFLSGADLIIYDEILDGLDTETVKKVIKYIKDIDKTIVIVTHFISLFRYLKYRLIRLKDGSIINDEYR